jgi:hypothetical protein
MPKGPIPHAKGGLAHSSLLWNMQQTQRACVLRNEGSQGTTHMLAGIGHWFGVCGFCFSPAVLGIELRAFTLSHSTSPSFCVMDFFEIGSHKLFARCWL